MANTGSQLLAYPLQFTYGTGAQIYKLFQYNSFSVNTSQTLTAQAWNGAFGGIFGICAINVVINGTLSANAVGFRPGFGGGDNEYSQSGESSLGLGSYTNSPNGMGGGGSYRQQGNSTVNGAGGGSYATLGGAGGSTGGPNGTGATGNTGGTAGLTTAFFGGAGGSGGVGGTTHGGLPGNGGISGGFILIIAQTITINGAVTVAGGSGGNASSFSGQGGGGGGAAGSILFKGQIIQFSGANANLGSIVTSLGGAGGAQQSGAGAGGAGGNGYIHADYLLTPTGTTSPAQDIRFDPILASASPMFALF